MMPFTLPQGLYGFDGIKEILFSGDNAILHKQLEQDLLNNEKLISAHSIVYVVNGKVSVTTYDGDEVTISNGEILFMPRDSYVISDFMKNGKIMEVFLLFFDHDIVMKFIEGIEKFKGQKSTICKLEATENIKNYFQNITKMKFENPQNKKLLELKLLEFLHLINEKQDFVQTLQSSEEGKQRRDIGSMMLEHYDKNMTIADFASLSGRSLSTFNREFKEKYHTTPKQWLIEKKMNRAFELLQDGKTVTESAFEVGYLNVSNFIKAYKSVYDETPKVMQKSIS
jgi:AraC-like DNA-binding protein